MQLPIERLPLFLHESVVVMRIDASRPIGQERRVLWGVLGTGKRVRDEASGLAWLLGLLCDSVLQTIASY